MTRGAGDQEDPTGEIAEFVATVSFSDLPRPALDYAERCFIDTVGVTLAGVTAGAGQLAVDIHTNGQSSGPARVLGHGNRVSVADAAFTNATAGHVHDYDDYAQSIIGHPSVVLVPTILAIGEREDLDGQDAIKAFVTGFETMAHLGSPYIEPFYRAGWFSTTLFGTIGAAAAASDMLGLDTVRSRAALNIATAMAAGTLRHNGTMSKPLQVGQAARSAVAAARYAAEGATASDVLTGKGGFFDLHINNPTPNFESFAPPDRWALLSQGIHLKKYPCCSDAHSAIAAAADLRKRYNFDPEAIETVTVRASGRARDVLRFDDPKDGNEAKFSMPYLVACMLVRGRVDIPDFEDRQVNDPTVQAVRETVEFERDPALSYRELEATVAVEVDDRSVKRTVTRPPGHIENPLTDAEIHEKFVTCASYSLEDEAGERAFECLKSLRSRSIRTVLDTLTWID